MNIVIFTAIKMEAAAVRRRLLRVGDAVAVHAVGLRASRLGDVPKLPAGSTIIIAGLAGGLDPALRVGDVVIEADNSVTTPSRCTRGRIYTSPQMIQSVRQKTALRASTEDAAVDMEQSIIADWARNLGHSVIGIRAISDSASDALDPILTTLIDDLGRPKPLAITKAILRRPARLPELIRLGRRSKLALVNLADVVAELVQSLH